MACPISNDEVQTSERVATPNSVVFEYLMQRDASFRQLVELKKKGWDNPLGDEYFKQKQSRLANAEMDDAYRFYTMNQQIADEIQEATNATRQTSVLPNTVKILDLCMAPGGYTASALKYNPLATAHGITLPAEEGGRRVLLSSQNSHVEFLDITMLAREFDVENPPSTHSDYSKFLHTRPYFEQQFHLVFCDGQVIRTRARPGIRESIRLIFSMLILALQRIRPGGTLIMLLTKIEAWDTMELLYLFSKFSSVEVFKSQQKYAAKSSFYLIARNVQSDTEAAKLSVRNWKQTWHHATFGDGNGTGKPELSVEDSYIHTVLDQFGGRFVELARPIWKIRASALDRMSFMKSK